MVSFWLLRDNLRCVKGPWYVWKDPVGMCVKRPWYMCEGTMVHVSRDHGTCLKGPWYMCEGTMVHV